MTCCDANPSTRNTSNDIRALLSTISRSMLFTLDSQSYSLILANLSCSVNNPVEVAKARIIASD
jgi:hypothetical protein